MTSPNVYDFQNHQLGIHVVYSPGTGGAIGGMQYSDPAQTLMFKQADLRVANAEIGTLVTATLRRTIDTGSTTFTLVLPAVNLPGPSQAVTVTTLGVNTVHRLSPIPSLNLGQVETDTPIHLSGTATFIPF